jgi:hypothetical protein
MIIDANEVERDQSEKKVKTLIWKRRKIVRESS